MSETGVVFTIEEGHDEDGMRAVDAIRLLSVGVSGRSSPEPGHRVDDPPHHSQPDIQQ